MPFCLWRWILCLSPALFITAAVAQDEESDFPPGLLARYTAADETVERVDANVAFVWGGDAPDPRLAAGPFTAEWTTLLLVRQQEPHRFHAYVQGEVTVELDGRTVLSGRRDEPGWISGAPVALSFGEQPLTVRFRKTVDAAQVRLFWSADSFPLEPIPTYLLFRDEGRPDLAKIEQGRRQFTMHRCNRCHRRAQDPESPPAPALTHMAADTDPDWLVAKIHQPHAAGDGARMPTFGHTLDESRAIAAYLLQQAEPVKLAKIPAAKTPDEDRRKGEVLFRSVGCLACHRVGKHGTDGPYSGGDLSDVARKRSAAWLFTWLAEPNRLNPDHRMPVFRLSGDERRQLAGYLSSLRKDGVEPAAGQVGQAFQPDTAAAKKSQSGKTGLPQLAARGRELIVAARCAACHRVPGIKADAMGLPDLSAADIDWSQSCLNEQADRDRHRPGYPQSDSDAIRAFVESRAGTLSPVAEFARGQHLLERRNCLACHQRDRSQGIVPVAGQMARLDDDLRGESEAMIPPALTAVGDKLLDAALAEAVSGQQKAVRMPWLHVRMPRFEHTPQENDALLAYLIGSDRVPDGGPQTLAASKPTATDAQILVTGQTLIGAKGFSCIACHKIGDYEPRNVALGTRGSDLWMLGRRMRPEYYLRWTASPQRVVPGMEMPSYKKPVAGVLGGDLRAQLRATWEALNAPRFTAPTNPSAVEQFLTVAPGEPARIVRDVFTLPKDEGGGYVPRAMAIGLNNGHNVLFDLDTFRLRQWTFGDFARQRTQGKSWYWDMAGVPVAPLRPERADVHLVTSGPLSRLIASPKNPHGELLSYRAQGAGVEFRYRLDFICGVQSHSLTVTETVLPLPADEQGRAGWERRVRVESLPDGYGAAVVTDVPHTGPVEPTARVREGAVRRDAVEDGLTMFLVPDGEDSAFGVLEYRAAYRRTDLPSPEPSPEPIALEPVTSVPGYDGVRLPLDRSIMPTAITWTDDGTLAFTSLKGHVYLAHDTDGDGIEDKLTIFEEGLAAPYGLIADGEDLIVAHKPELLRLRDTDGDGRADVREVIATGWGYTDNYHDWTCGIVRDSAGNLYIGLGSDYAQPQRPQDAARWRGKVLRISPAGEITPVGHAFRYPTGLAITADDQIFVSDNQGVQNTFNEINHLVAGRHYGVPSRHEEHPDAESTPPAVQVPHPWTRSVNGLFFLPAKSDRPFAGHGIGCEYDSRFLVRFTLQEVDGEYQGAAYAFSRPNAGAGGENFSGPLCGAVGPDGDLYIGSIFDSGWLGGTNTGAIVRLRPNGRLPNGLRELRATADGFVIDFIAPVDPQAAARPENYTLSGYRRIWQGAYATPDSDRHRVEVESVHVSPDARRVTLRCDGLREGFVYEVTCGRIGTDKSADLWPATGHYTLHRQPGS